MIVLQILLLCLVQSLCDKPETLSDGQEQPQSYQATGTTTEPEQIETPLSVTGGSTNSGQIRTPPVVLIPPRNEFTMPKSDKSEDPENKGFDTEATYSLFVDETTQLPEHTTKTCLDPLCPQFILPEESLTKDFQIPTSQERKKAEKQTIGPSPDKLTESVREGKTTSQVQSPCECTENTCSRWDEESSSSIDFSSVCFKELSEGERAARQATKEDYCRLFSRHTMCLYDYNKFAAACGPVQSAYMTEYEKNLIVHVHNEKRAFVANGKELRGRPGPQSPASNMLQMEWDEELAIEAQMWINQCIYNHDCSDCRTLERFKVGQNLMRQTSTIDHITPNWRRMVETYYNEVEFMDRWKVDNYVDDKGVGHYTQVVWAQTRYVGCGRINYMNAEGKYVLLIGCNYGPAGNVDGKPLYRRGTPCSQCPFGFQCSSAYSGLCSPTLAEVHRSAGTLKQTELTGLSADCHLISEQQLPTGMKLVVLQCPKK